MSRVVAAICGAVCAAAAPVACMAQTASASPDRGPFRGGTVGVQIAGMVGIEAWNLNGSNELVGDVAFSAWWSFKDGMSLVAELHAMPVAQTAPRTAFVTAFSPMVRFRLLRRGDTTVYVDGGLGAAWSDTTVPPRGTRFNFLIITSLGITQQITRQTAAVVSVRIVHLSNANRAGPDRNPDIESVGGYFGVCVGF